MDKSLIFLFCIPLYLLSPAIIYVVVLFSVRYYRKLYIMKNTVLTMSLLRGIKVLKEPILYNSYIKYTEDHWEHETVMGLQDMRYNENGIVEGKGYLYLKLNDKNFEISSTNKQKIQKIANILNETGFEIGEI